MLVFPKLIKMNHKKDSYEIKLPDLIIQLSTILYYFLYTLLNLISVNNLIYFSKYINQLI